MFITLSGSHYVFLSFGHHGSRNQLDLHPHEENCLSSTLLKSQKNNNYLVIYTDSTTFEWPWKNPAYNINECIKETYTENVSKCFLVWVSHYNFSRSLAEHFAGWVVPVAIVGNRLMWKIKPHTTRWTTMERHKAHTSRFRAKPCLSTPSLDTRSCYPYEITSTDTVMCYMSVHFPQAVSKNRYSTF